MGSWAPSPWPPHVGGTRGARVAGSGLPPASGRLPGERGSLPWSNGMARPSLVFRVSAWSNRESGVGGLGDLRPCGDASPAPVAEKPVLIPCWNCFCDLLFVAFVIIIILNTLPQRILPLYLAVN